jgi:hypothetical protein
MIMSFVSARTRATNGPSQCTLKSRVIVVDLIEQNPAVAVAWP